MKLYRFEKATRKRCDTLRGKKFWASSPSMFNDLYDCRIKIENKYTCFHPDSIEQVFSLFYKSVDGSDELYREVANLSLMKIQQLSKSKNGKRNLSSYMTFERRIEECIIKQNSVVCFFASSITNPLMWAHYGNNHTGFCVEYDVDVEDNRLYQVNYSTELPSISLEELALCPRQCIDRVLMTKKAEWLYENEFRIIEPLDTGNGKLIDIPRSLTPTKVILGSKFDIGNHGKALYIHAANIAASLKISLSRMMFEDHKFYEKIIIKREADAKGTQ